MNFDHPDSIDFALLAEQLSALREGRSIEMPVYSFVEETRLEGTVQVAPRRVVIVEGILVFVEPHLRRELDIKIFVDTEADIRAIRRIRRDMRSRGRDFEAVRAQYYDTVRPMHLQFVEPSKREADLIIPEGGENRVAIDVLLARLREATRGMP